MGTARGGGGVVECDGIDTGFCADGGVANSFTHCCRNYPFHTGRGGADDCHSLPGRAVDGSRQGRRNHVGNLDFDDVPEPRADSACDPIFPEARMTFILDPKTSPEDAPWGGKGRALYQLTKAGFNVPEWIAISPEAYQNENISDALRSAAKDLVSGNEYLAVRSSAGDEDGSAHSFAGQLESFLYIRPDDVPEAVKKVWESGFTERVLAYRREHKLAGPPRAPTVLVQRMIDAESAGVAFSADPVSGDKDVAVVSAVRGVGSALVAGEVDADTWHVSREGAILKRYIAYKAIAHDQNGAKTLSRE